MTRLTIDLKDEITYKAIEQKFKPVVKKLLDRQHKLNMKIYNKVYSKKGRELFESLPKGLMFTSECLKVQIGADVTNIYFNPLNNYYTGAHKAMPRSYRFKEVFDVKDYEVNRLPMPYEDRNRVVEIFEATSKIATEYTKIKQDIKEVSAEISTVSKELRSTLDKFTTVKKLDKEWKEIMRFVPEATKKNTLPAIPVVDINKKLGLIK